MIMDGNRRWAKQNNKSVKEGHKSGIDKLNEVIIWCKNRSIKYLTFYTFSNENWNRSPSEVADLMELIENFLTEKSDELEKDNIKVRVIGRRDGRLKNSILKRINEIEAKTSKCDGMQVNIAFNYGGRQEIVDVTKKIIGMGIKEADIDEKLFNNNLYYGDIPHPDLVVRTSGEQRISGFLLWEIAYSEFYFLDKYWPEFDEATLDRIIEDYNKRERRLGK
jgi:undecaprenyl diphosphate synthase